MIYNNNSFLYALANCGIMTKNIAKKFFKVHHPSLNYMTNNNIIYKKGNLLLFGKATTIFVLSENTKNDIRKLGKAPYKTNTSQLEHDYLLLRTYSSLPLNLQSSWKNETELKEIYNSDTTTDGMFIYNNKKIGIEIITPNYTNNMIDKKRKFGDMYFDRLITMNTSDIKII